MIKAKLPVRIALTLLAGSVAAFSAPPAARLSNRPSNRLGPADLSNLVVVGDSLSAGVQNFSLLDSQQVHGYAKLIAIQAQVPLILPLVPSPGAPNKLYIENPGPPPVIAPIAGTLPAIPRDNPTSQPTNLSVPGITVDQALTLLPNPNADPTDPVAGWANLVLGFPVPFVTPGTPQSEVQQAVALHPTTIILWLGNNDALIPALFGSDPTPISSFASSFLTVMQTLSATHARIIVANIPDVTSLPYFTSVAQLALESGLPLNTVASKLGVGPTDLLRPAAVPFAQQILAGAPGPLSNYMCTGQPLSPEPAPCVFTASQVLQFQGTVLTYNAIIQANAQVFGATFVDIYSLVRQIHDNGYSVNGDCLTTSFLGGLFSLDGVHPSNTGYAVIANAFIQQMNQFMGTSIPAVSVGGVASSDPLVFPSSANSCGGPDNPCGRRMIRRCGPSRYTELTPHDSAVNPRGAHL